MKDLVRLWKRPSRDGKRFSYVLIFKDEQGKIRYESLGHASDRKAQRQRSQKERELRMGVAEPVSMKLSEFLEDGLTHIRGQIRENTTLEYDSTMRQFIEVVGDIDYRRIRYEHGELFIQVCLDGGNRPATVAKKIGILKQLFQLAVQRGHIENSPFRFVSKPKAVEGAKCPVSNFRYQFLKILERADIDLGTFHDLRRTCITNWLANGLSEFDVMTMAGHASFETTRRFYLAVRSDLLDRARKVSSMVLKSIAVAKPLHVNAKNSNKRA